MKMSHVMISIKTMDITPEAAIVSIGGVIFDPRIGIESDKTFYSELDWTSQGRSINRDTEIWWDNQPNNAQDVLFGLDELPCMLAKFAEFLPKNAKVWGNGATFDVSIIENAYRQCGITIPWKYWNIRDMRTITDIYESSRGGLYNGYDGNSYHALHDAINKSRRINLMWAKILNG